MQQGYVFGHVSLCMYGMYVCIYTYIHTVLSTHTHIYIYIYNVDKKRAVWGLTIGKSPVSVIYCSLVKFNGQRRGLLCQAIRSGKEIWRTILLTGRKKVLEIVVW